MSDFKQPNDLNGNAGTSSGLTSSGSGIFSGNIMGSNKASDTATGEKPLTFGQQVVGVRFNPSGMGNVDVVKQMFAQLIDDAQARTWEGGYPYPPTQEQNVTRAARAFVHQEAISKLTDACMAVVKSIVTK